MPSAIASPMGLRNSQRTAIAPTIRTARTPISGMTWSRRLLRSIPGGIGGGVGPCITTATPGAGPAPWRATARRNPCARTARPPRDAAARWPRALPRCHRHRGPAGFARAVFLRTPSRPATRRSSRRRSPRPRRWESAARRQEPSDALLMRRDAIRTALLGQEPFGKVQALLHLGHLLTELLHFGGDRVALLGIRNRSPVFPGDPLGDRGSHRAQHPEAADHHEGDDDHLLAVHRLNPPAQSSVPHRASRAVAPLHRRAPAARSRPRGAAAPRWPTRRALVDRGPVADARRRCAWPAQ